MTRPLVRAVLFTRYPVAGEAKTRLIPAVGAQAAADIHAALTLRTVDILKQCDCHLEIAITGAPIADFRKWLGEDICFKRQQEGDLTDRLLAEIDPAPLIFFGSDTPDLSEDIVAEAIAALGHHDLVVGPAEDGGYYLIGMRQAAAGLFTDMPWSTDKVLTQTLARAAALNMTVHQTRLLSDCDTPDDLKKWPWLNIWPA
ncbi:TIGR04282 family arsenosugar biosynthesis glycosyltransferase [Sphingorhabdus arenilitoris]|uniref:TIGR04282 family arsenosugar biosynthesis glycosyltransferase n=1 Tax=Sphingorhabdus arenilitoris TaxID=1490041 RepID=A0ABV8RFD1_9SPHN